MEVLIAQLTQYLHELLGTTVRPVPWEGVNRLPFLLQDGYGFYRARVLDMDCLFMVDRNEPQRSPGVIAKHLGAAENASALLVVFVRSAITTYNRKRLIGQKVPFIVPGNQMYLPMLGVDLREHFRAQRTRPERFSPSTQAILIHCLSAPAPADVFAPSQLTGALGYSAMTMSRAFGELTAADVGESVTHGRERWLRFRDSKRETWDRALSFLRSPVRKRHFIRMSPPVPTGPQAGLTALAHYSMLAEPTTPVSAMLRSEWKELKHADGVTLVPGAEPGGTEIEVWSYAPSLFAESGVVDRLSLYLSLRDTADERVESALEEMMEGMAW